MVDPARNPDFQPRRPGPGAPINPAAWGLDRKMMLRCIKRLELNRELATLDHQVLIDRTIRTLEGALRLLDLVEATTTGQDR